MKSGFPLNDYKDKNVWRRYILQKNTPCFLYPFLLKYFYYKFQKKHINLKQPKSFTEKLNYLKVFDATKQKTMLADKILVKKYVEEKTPELKVAKLYQMCNSFEEIDFSSLPKTFVIKTNHACRTNILVLDKDDLTEKDYKEYSQYYKKVLAINYAFWGTLEMQYKNIIPKVYVEEFIKEKLDDEEVEIEVHCFNGNPTMIFYHQIKNGKDKVALLDENFKTINTFGIHVIYNDCDDIQKKHKNSIIEIAKKLAKDINYVRVDLCLYKDNLYFREMTFTPASGDLKIKPRLYDYVLGEKLKI